MYNWKYIILLNIVVLQFCCCKEVAPKGIIDELIVEAMVVSNPEKKEKVYKTEKGEYKEEFFLNNLKISHVYSGPEELLGKELLVRSEIKRPEGSWSSKRIYPSLKKDEIVILTINNKAEILEYTPFGDIVKTIYRKNIDKEFEHVHELVKMVEKINSKDGNELMLLLKDNINNENPDIAQLSMKLLYKSDPAKSVKLFKELLKKKQINVISSVYADNLILEADENWRDSVDRKDLFYYWANDDRQIALVIQELLKRSEEALKKKYITPDVYIDMITTAGRNLSDESDLKKWTMLRLGRNLKLYENNDQINTVFDYFISILDTTENEKLMKYICQVIVTYYKLDEKNRGKLLEIAKNTDNPTLKKLIKDIIEKDNVTYEEGI